jgi:molecular chaperone DnaK
MSAFGLFPVLSRLLPRPGLQQAGYKLAEIVYSDQEAQTNGQSGAANAQPNGGDDVVDADYEVVDE